MSARSARGSGGAAATPRAFAIFACACAVLSAAIWVQYARGNSAYARSGVALGLGNRAQAVLDCTEAARTRAPFSPYPELGRMRLRAIANDAEKRGETELAVAALRGLGIASGSDVGGAGENAEQREIAARLAVLVAPAPPLPSALGAEVGPARAAEPASLALPVETRNGAAMPLMALSGIAWIVAALAARRALVLAGGIAALAGALLIVGAWLA